MAKLPRIVYLVIGIPLSSLVVGVVMLIAASTGSAPAIQTPAAQPDEQPLSKTSWQQTHREPAP